MTPDEEERLLQAAHSQFNPMVWLMIRLALATAMRAGEIQRLCRSDVDLKRRRALLRDTKSSQARTVPLSNEATSILREAFDSPILSIDCEDLLWRART
ncbi:MAG TPA: tyrosine-type recombinase/integrase [Salinisphaeraceae bacterium]|nr:tyrosine-type recombinase/integrase [Salinisphaeraceae bacterium]